MTSPLESTCLGTQCGVAGTLQGSPVNAELQRRKLEPVALERSTAIRRSPC